MEQAHKTINESIEVIKNELKERFSGFEMTMSIMVAIGVAALTVIIVLFFGVWKIRTKVLPSQSGLPRRPRFRKRDKVLFYGRKMLRKVRSFTNKTVGAYSNLGQGRGKAKKRQLVMKLAKNYSDLRQKTMRLLQMRRDSTLPQLQVKEPPQSFLETDSSEIEESENRLPSEVLYMLKSTRVFGHFENPVFLELVKHMEVKKVHRGEYLFNIGDADDSIYVVQEGQIDVSIIGPDSKDYLVKEAKSGDSIHSLLSILDVLTDHKAPYKTVSAVAKIDSVILRLPAIAFKTLFERFPESLVRVVQIIMIRLQRVTFTALHNYLGLSSELINPLHEQPELKPGKSRLQYKRHSIATSIPIVNVIQSGTRTMSIHAVTPQASPYKRQASEPVHEHLPDSAFRPDGRARAVDDIDADKLKSDFDMASMRARVSSTDVPQKINEEKGSASSLRNKPKKFSDTGSLVSQSSVETNDEEVIELAKKDLVNILHLEDESLLDGKLTLQKVKAGSTLVSQGDQDSSIIFLVTGTIMLLQDVVGKEKKDQEKKEVMLHYAYPGELVGAMAVLTGEPSFFTFRAKTDVRIVVISKNNFYSIMRAQPSVVLGAAHTTAMRMTPFVRQIDFALDWMMLEAGKALFRQGDHSDSIYIVLTGRLRSVITKSNGKKELVGEYGRGELVGIVEVLTDTERTTTIMAVRDTECAKLPAELLNLIKRKFPQIVTRLIHLLGQRLLGQLQTKSSGSVAIGDNFLKDKASTTNLATVAVLPVSKEVPLINFSLELQRALSIIGPTMRLTSEIVKANLGNHALDSGSEFRLFNWLGQQEDMHRMTIYQCDYTMTKWTKCCIRQADCILIVAMFGRDPAMREVEQQMEHMAVRAQKELILLHPEDSETPTGTVNWLNARGWCSSHHHMRCPPRVLSKRSEAKVQEMYDKLKDQEVNRMGDFSRLARFLTGTSVGLVLGGGGARGLSHVGMIRAMVEAGIPIDMVAGTSMGSFIGALWCEELNITTFMQRTREWSFGMTSLAKKILDLTYPVTSMFTGGAFNEGIESTFKNRQIEDLWLPYFCITTDISSSSMRVHTHGSLWRYVRASMSLSGYLPPLCDPVDGHYLLDGGYVNNLPADVMKSFGAQNIFAVDVGSIDETNLTNYGDKLSGWWLLWKRWNPWAEQVKVPDMAEIQSRLAYVSCVRQLEMVKNSDFCEYIRPPIDKYGTLQFGAVDEIADVGYHHGKTLFSGWVKGGLIKELFKEKPVNLTKSTIHRVETNVPVLAKFTDLAELVSKIDEPKQSNRPLFYEPNAADDEEFTDEDDEIILEEEEDELEEYEDEEDVSSENEETKVNTTQNSRPIVVQSRLKPKTIGPRKRITKTVSYRR